MTSLLPTPIQSQSLTDKDGKPTSHFYRWMDGVHQTLNSIVNNAPGIAPYYVCRAWVNFDGTKDTTGAASTSNTNRLILGSGNVTSILRNSTGSYTVTFSTPMPDANYAPLCTLGLTSGLVAFRVTQLTTTSIGIFTFNTSFTSADCAGIYLSIFR